MREFMVHVQNAFYNATGWSQDNSYSTLNSTAHELLCFPTPQGLRLSLSSLATPHFATSYQLGSIGIVDGSVSYLYSSAPLKDHFDPQSESLPLPILCRGYRSLQQLPRRDPVQALQPISLLEALVIKRFSSGLQLQLRAVSSKSLRNGGSLLGLAQYDVGKFSVEGLASSDGRHCSLATMLDFNVYSYESNWSVGMELWRKEFLRRVEDPAAQLEAPLSTTHSLVTTDPAVVKAWSRSMQAKLEWRLDEPAAHAPTSLGNQKEVLSRTETAGGKEEDYSGVIKARISQNSTIGILWEGRVKALIYSIGSGIDLHRPDQPFRTLGLEVQYSS
ncbi:unnamed protein product [Parascedosporium putredinis]|uniref:Mitochondrial distribution and morphology protein 10 n=1 Tax=Parascedosporium putredinis TaxID=1442378 RepID=A0A9P1H9D4_9PEZI|nr:unnamed protein product [Parascedosporium putredinis]CAI8002982.1 unnamed protein product [Parascedosporium putredinis]